MDSLSQNFIDNDEDNGHFLWSNIPRINIGNFFVFCRNAHLEIIFVKMRSFAWKQIAFQIWFFRNQTN